MKSSLLIFYLICFCSCQSIFSARLHDAVASGDINKVKEYLKKGFLKKVHLKKEDDINAKDKEGNAPLHIASDKGNYNIVKLLLDRNANVNIKDEDGNTPLMIAIMRKHPDIARLLLERKDIDVHVKNAPKFFVSYGYGDTPSYSPSGGEETALHFAVSQNLKGIVKLLLDKGADVNAKNLLKETPLIIALAKQYLDIARLLLERKNINVNIQKQNGDTALYIASAKGNYNIVRLLLDRNANVNIKNRDGNTPLIIAVIHKHLDIVRLLLTRKDIDVNIKISGDTALHIAVKKGFKDIVKLLLDKGVNVNVKNSTKFNYRIYPPVPKGGEEAALHIAVKQGFKDIVKLLLERKDIDVNIQNKMGDTALHIVVRNDLKDIVKLLLDKGADVTIKGAGGHMPLDDAKDEQIKSMLKEAEKKVLKKRIKELKESKVLPKL